MARKSRSEHVVMRNGHPFCLNCGQSYVINLPAPIPVVTGAINGFIKTHKDCKKTWEEPVPDMTEDMPSRIVWWYKNGHRGTSSETILANFVTVKGEIALNNVRLLLRAQWSHPRDPADFNRCHKLLEVVPEIRENLDQMRTVSPVWNNLVDNWDRLTEMLKEHLKGGDWRPMANFMVELGC